MQPLSYTVQYNNCVAIAPNHGVRRRSDTIVSPLSPPFAESHIMRIRILRSWILMLVTAALISACGKGGAPQQQQMPPAEVGVLVAKAQAVPITRDLVGRISATRTADVRARVPGVLQKRVYTEGANVKEGELLFKIDPAPLQAALNVESANLAAAQATYTNNQ